MKRSDAIPRDHLTADAATSQLRKLASDAGQQPTGWATMKDGSHRKLSPDEVTDILGRIDRAELLAVVGRREGASVEDLEIVIKWVQALPRMPLPRQKAEAMEKLTPEQQRLAEKALRDGGKE